MPATTSTPKRTFAKIGKFHAYYNEIHTDGDVYMRRWILSTPWGHLRVHNILRGDRDPALHDHPFDFWSFMLRGSYRETLAPELADGSHALLSAAPLALKTTLRTWAAPALIRRKAEDLHRLDLDGGPVWTLVWTGPLRRMWGFQTPKGWAPFREYEGGQ